MNEWDTYYAKEKETSTDGICFVLDFNMEMDTKSINVRLQVTELQVFFKSNQKKKVEIEENRKK